MSKIKLYELNSSREKALKTAKRFFEEYKCGCVSDVVPAKKDLLGYCPLHGTDRRCIHPA